MINEEWTPPSLRETKQSKKQKETNMKKQIIIFLLLILIVSALLGNEETILQSTKAKYLNITTYQAEITQENIFTQHDMSTLSKGQIFIDKKSIVLEYTEPDYYFLKVDNGEITMYSEVGNMAIINSDDGSYGNMVLHFSSLMSKDFEFFEIKDNLYIFTIISPLETVQDLMIYINPTDALIETIKYSDDMDNKVIINIKNQLFNTELRHKIEDFVIPDEVSIIEN